MKIFDFKIPDEEFKQRRENLKKNMERENIDLTIVAGDEFFQANVRYLSDYRAILEDSIVLMPLNEEPVLVVGPECKTWAEQNSRIEKILVCSDTAVPEEEYSNIVVQSLEEILKDIAKRNSIKKVGLTHMNKVPYNIIKPVNKVFDSIDIVDASNIIEELRMIKSQNEIKIMKYSYQATKSGLEKALENVEIGMPEAAIAGIAAQEIYNWGVEQLAHTFLVSSGMRTRAVVAFPDPGKKVEDGDIVLVCIGSIVRGYLSDMAGGRTVGNASKERKDIVKLCKEVQQIAISKMKAGVHAREVDAPAREHLMKSGYGENQLYGICAHAVGLQHCETPLTGPHADFVLQEGMVFAVDGGLFEYPFGGCRNEIGVVVTRDGTEPMAV